eukprot:GHVP01029225.1.p1 GENE.GHVP01029225.1~~GHVP01029225.1.p1  ORF type:complete len:633 (+),score=120.23 GHVP01029225.1:194-1900(+)
MEEPKQRAEVSLYDCLACSGCVTSAEVIFIESQNTRDLLKKLIANKHQETIFVVSLSLQTRVLFAAQHNMSVEQATRKLCGFFALLGFSYSLDTNTADFWALRQNIDELMRKIEIADSNPVLVSHCPGFVCYAEKTLEKNLVDQIAKSKSSQQLQGRLVKTLFAGKLWEYVFRSTIHSTGLSAVKNPFSKKNISQGCSDSEEEKKKQIEEALPFQTPDSTPDVNLQTSSPKAEVDPKHEKKLIMEKCLAAAKERDLVAYFREEITKMWKSQQSSFEETKVACGCVSELYSNKSFYSKRIYHVTIGPCFDKKLECIREESNVSTMPEVDLALSSFEVDQLLDLIDIEFKDLPNGTLDNIFLSRLVPLPYGVTLPRTSLSVAVENSGTSNGFAYRALKELTRMTSGNSSEAVEFKTLANEDLKEAITKGGKSYRVWSSYGFRNIQNTTKKIRQDEKAVNLVEIMACPGGCLNGGGQRLVKNPAKDRENLKKEMHARITSDKYSENLAIFQEVQTNSGELCTIVDPMRDPAVSFCVNYMQSFSTLDNNGLTMKYRVLKDSEVGVLASSLNW